MKRAATLLLLLVLSGCNRHSAVDGAKTSAGPGTPARSGLGAATGAAAGIDAGEVKKP